MTNPKKVLEAIDVLVDGDPSREFKRNELRKATGLDEGQFGPIFQWMSGGPGAPIYDKRFRGILAPVEGRPDGWRRLSTRGIALLLDGTGEAAPDAAFPLIDVPTVGHVLQSLDGYRFDTSDFVRVLHKTRPDILVAIERRYGRGGQGAGRYYSAYTHIAKSLSRYARKWVPDAGSQLVFEQYVSAPAGWGSSVIAMWICGAADAPEQYLPSAIDDIEEFDRGEGLSATERQRMATTRIGQSDFRRALLLKWKRCPLTGCADPRALVASHIKRWCDSDNRERLDPFNGLLLTPNADRLFDQYLISIDDDGRLVRSPQLAAGVLPLLGIRDDVRIALDDRHLIYLRWHRKRMPL